MVVGQLPLLGFCALAVINFIGSFGCAITGFGENIIFQLGWYWMSLVGLSSGSLTESVTILTIIQWPILLTQTALTWRYVNVNMALVLAVMSSISSAAGVAILVRYDNSGLKQVLGATLLCVFLWRLFLDGRGNKAPPPDRFDVWSWPNGPMLATAGLLSGLLGGLFSTPGPPNMVFVLLANVGKDEWRSTQAMVGLIQLPVRLFALLFEDPGEGLWHLWPACAVSLAFGLVGTVVGNRAAPYVSEAAFKMVIMAFLLTGGLSMLAGHASASALLEPRLALPVAAIAAALLAALLARARSTAGSGSQGEGKAAEGSGYAVLPSGAAADLASKA